MDRTLLIGAPEFPARLRELSSAPRQIHLRGNLPSLSPSVAIVGARRASEQGRRLAENIARDVARAGVLVISGGALGVDIAAHRGALSAKQPTLVVLPTPLSRPAPREHRRLFDQILQLGGAWLSEHDGTRDVARWDFCTRNRLIAALADLVLVIEATDRSGTRHTVDAAIALGRPLAAVPWAVGDPRGAGCIEVLRRAARAVTCGDDVLAILGVTSRAADRAEVALESAELGDRVLALVELGVGDVDALARRAGAPVAEILATVTRLEVGGAIANRGGRIERRCAPPFHR